MSGRVGDDKIAEVRERTSIVELVSRYTALRRTGRNHQGLCPFHSEKTPSFSVSEERGLFYCFGCQASGDVFKFLMLKDSLTFPEALERLAREAGVELPKRPAEERREQGRERLLRVNAFATKFFQRALWEGPAGAPARDYLAERKIREDTARAFGLGYAPPNGLARAFESVKAPLADAESLGLIGRSTRGGGWFDRFRSRLIFPITDLSGKTIAFGGRLLAAVEGQPKYLNSPESPLFQKRRSVFGLAAARDAINERRRVVLVEGYIDVIALAQAEIRNVVAPLGTSLTGDQIRLLKRFTDEFLVLFDGDRAGIAAAARAFAVFAEVGVFAEAAFLPEGHDPDTFVRQKGAAAIEAILERASPLVDHYLRSLAAPDASLAARRRAADQVTEMLSRLESSTFVGMLQRVAAGYFGISEDQLTPRGPGRRSEPEQLSTASRTDLTSHESQILELLLVRPELVSKLPPAIDSIFASGTARALFERIRAEGDPRELLGQLPRDAADRVARAWLGEPDIYPDPQRMLDECLKGLAERTLESRLRAITQKIREAQNRGDTGEAAALLAEKHKLSAARPRTEPAT
jgi:DNA primase